MAESKNEGTKSSPGASKDPQREQKKKTLLAALIMVIPFLGVMYLIIGSGEEKEIPGQNSFNMTVPDGRSPGIEASKQKALERVNAEQQQQQRTQIVERGSLTLFDDSKSEEQT